MSIIPAGPAGGFSYEIPTNDPSPLETFATVFGSAVKGRQARQQARQDSLKSIMPSLITAGQVAPTQAGQDPSFKFAGMGFSAQEPQQNMGDLLKFYQMIDEKQKVEGTSPLSPRDYAPMAVQMMQSLNQDFKYQEALQASPEAAEAYRDQAFSSAIDMLSNYNQQQMNVDDGVPAAYSTTNANEQAFSAALKQQKQTTPQEYKYRMKDPASGRVVMATKSQRDQALALNEGWVVIGEVK